MLLGGSSALADTVDMPGISPAEPITIQAEAGNRWQQGQYEVWLLRGNCRITQGPSLAESQEAVVWILRSEVAAGQHGKVIAYLEGDVAIRFNAGPRPTRLADRSWFGRFFTAGHIGVQASQVAAKPNLMPPIFQRGMQHFFPATNRLPATSGPVLPVQYTVPSPTTVSPPSTIPSYAAAPSAVPPNVAPAYMPPVSNAAPNGPTQVPAPGFTPTPQLPAVAGPTLTAPSGAGSPELVPPGVATALPSAAPAASRRIRVFPRSNVPVQAQWFPDPNTNQWIAIIDSGVNLIVDGLANLGSIDVATDRLVIWTNSLEEPDLTGQSMQDGNVPLEIYMEGNIVFRQGERVIYAERMYYDVANQVGTVLQAEVLTPVPNYQGLLRLKADVLRQTGRDRFFAQNTFITSSRLGQPSYRIEAGEIQFEDHQIPAYNPLTGMPEIDPATGEQLIDHQRMATSRGNTLFLGEVPIFYWPTLATDLNEPTFYVRNVRMKNDNVFGTQFLTTLDGFQLLGIQNKPRGMEWDINLDYLSDRGFGHGTALTYAGPRLFGPEPTAGLFDYWGIKDDGFDTLGQGREHLRPEKNYRWRLFWQHRQEFADDYQLSVEAGWISDRNFLEQYYEQEWEELKDETTGVELKRIRDNSSWSLTTDARMNSFFTQTEWLPRADHFWLGESLFGDRLTWYEHSKVGYARFKTASAPRYADDTPFDYLPWETTLGGQPLFVEGEVAATRQEIDLPMQLGAVKVVPYALGELAHWGADRTGDDLQRVYWQTGVRASVPMWRVDPTVKNHLFNLNGLAHKVTFDAELAIADANRDIDLLPLYDPIDDDSVEAFRRRLAMDTFGLPQVPAKFDARYYALRTGLGGWVTSPSTEIADDLKVLRMGMHHRWQTKRGMPGRERIIDWVTFNANASYFPDADRDNFGTGLGLVDYDARWHVGDRLTFVSDGIFDFFDDGQKVVTVGAFLSRPPRGDLYLGFRVLEGPISHQVVSMSYSYWMSPKWLSTFGMSVDLGGDGNIGQNFSITRIGESLLISAGVTVDAARDNVGVNLAIEPRFLPATRLGRVGGAQIPPAGAFGLE